MEINTFVEDLATAEKFYCRTPFAEQLFTVHLLVDHLLMTDSTKAEIM